MVDVNVPVPLEAQFNDLKKLVPGVCNGISSRRDETCGFQPDEPACQLARLNYRFDVKGHQPFACGYGPRNRDCSDARRRFLERIFDYEANY